MKGYRGYTVVLLITILTAKSGNHKFRSTIKIIYVSQRHDHIRIMKRIVMVKNP